MNPQMVHEQANLSQTEVDARFSQIAAAETDRDFDAMVHGVAGGMAVSQTVEAPAGMPGFDMQSMMAMNTQFESLSLDAQSTRDALASDEGKQALHAHNYTMETLSADNNFRADAEAGRQQVMQNQQQRALHDAYTPRSKDEDAAAN